MVAKAGCRGGIFILQFASKECVIAALELMSIEARCLEPMNGDDDGLNREWLWRVVQVYERPLMAYALRLMGDADNARDIVQDTFLRLCGQPPQKVAGEVRAWLYKVCRNRA